MKSAVLFVCHFVNDFSIEQFKRVKHNISKDDFTVYYCTSEQDKEKFKNKGIDNLVQYDNSLVKRGSFLDPFRVLLELKDTLNKYKNVYVIEYDVYFSEKWSSLLAELEREDSDLLATYIRKFQYPNGQGWVWTANYFATHDSRNPGLDQNIEYYLKSCLSFMKISVRALNFIRDYNGGDLKNFIYEMYVPTLLYNYGFKVKSLSSFKGEDDPEFNYLQLATPQTFYYTCNFTDYEVMNKMANKRPMLFTCYKEQITKNKIVRKSNAPVEMSVVMPVYNAEKYLKEAIDSVLNQVDAPSFEFVIINDGSSDSSKDIIESYNDDRIVYIEKAHSGIVDTLNTGIRNSLGKYIVRFDSDDMMYNNRLAVQYAYMEGNEDVDICGFGFEWGNGKAEKEYFKYDNPNITIDILKRNNCIGHPTVIMRSESIKQLPYLYESYFEKCEDYKLWCTAASYGLHLASCSIPVIYYRMHENQETQSSSEKMWKNTARIKKAYQTHDSVTNGQITVIIPFKNEGYEIEKTVASVRGTTTNLPIILINDGSTDGYDYKKMADFWGCVYVEHKESIGVAQSRDKGISMSTTEFFLILDGHMRFYEDNWDVRLLKLAQENPKAILSAETAIIHRLQDESYENEMGNTHNTGGGAYVNFDEPGWEFTGKWTHIQYPGYENSSTVPTPCLMGACYCSNKTWWNHIGGLQGLIMWGQDEPLMSIKTWLAGGEILLIKDLIAGHIYRERAPYPFPANRIYSNSIMLNHLFGESEEDIAKLDSDLKKRIGEQCFNEAMGFYKEHEDKCEEFKKHFYENVAVKDLKWFKEFNDKCYVHKK